MAFGIYKALNGGMWLSRAEPFVTWGPAPNAKRYPSEADAWWVISRLSYKDGNGAAVVTLE